MTEPNITPLEDRKTLGIAGGLLALFLIGSVAIVLTLQAPDKPKPAPTPQMDSIEQRITQLEMRLNERISRVEQRSGNSGFSDLRIQALQNRIDTLERRLAEQNGTMPTPQPIVPRAVPYGRFQEPPVSTSPRLTIAEVTGDARLKTADGRWWQLTPRSDFAFAPGSCIAVATGARLVYVDDDGNRSLLHGQSLLRASGAGDCQPQWSSYGNVPVLNGRLEDQPQRP